MGKVRAAQIERERLTAEARRKLRREIVRAGGEGASIRYVAAAAGVSRQWVWQIVKDDESK